MEKLLQFSNTRVVALYRYS